MSWPGCNYGQRGYVPSEGDFEKTEAMLAAALDAGINLIDTAEGYGCGLAEEMAGRGLEKLGARGRTIIATKVGPLFGDEQENGRTCNLSPAHIRERCEMSLRRLRTDHIDLYLAHWPDPQTPIEETIGIMNELRSEGKVRAFGVSNFPNELLGEALKTGEVVANQLPYSLADHSIDDDKRPFCIASNVGIMAYTPLGKGVLSGKYTADHLPPADDYRHQRKYFDKAHLPEFLDIAQHLRVFAEELSCTAAQVALAWVLSREGITTALPGAKSAEQIRLNAEAAEIPLPGGILERFRNLLGEERKTGRA